MATTNGTAKNISLWILKVLLGLAFLGAGASKLAGSPQMVAIFTKIGMDPWLRIVTGLIEVLCAIGLFIPRLTGYAALALVAVMVGAIGFHLTVLGGNPAPPIVLLLLSATAAWLSFSRKA